MNKKIQVELSSRYMANKIMKGLDENKYQIFPFCTGKYKWNDNLKRGNLHVVDSANMENVLLLWTEKRKDNNGYYAKIMCICEKPNYKE